MTPLSELYALRLDDGARRHLRRALDGHAAWCRSQGVAMPSALAALAFVVNGGHERPTLGASGANADDWLVPMVFTYDEVASLLRTSDRTVRRLVRAGDLPVIKVGGQPRVARADLDDYVARLRARRESELSNGPE